MKLEKEYVWEYKGNLVHLSEREIYFLQLEERVIYVHTRDHRYPIGRGHMDDEEEYLREMPTIRPHYSFLVNMRHVRMVGRTEVIMRNGAHVPIAGTRKKAVREAIQAYFRSRKNRKKSV